MILTYKALKDALISALQGGHTNSIKNHLNPLVTCVIFIKEVLYEHLRVHIFNLFNKTISACMELL
jgi:hypothetical protein